MSISSTSPSLYSLALLIFFRLESSMILFICYSEIIRRLCFTNEIFSELSDTETERKTKKQAALLLILVTVAIFIYSLPFHLLT